MEAKCANTECSNSFKTNRLNQRYCSEKCRVRADRVKLGRRGIGLASGTTGAISELVASTELMQRGWAVFRSLSPACFCDLLAVKGLRTLKIEVRTGYRNPSNGTLAFPRTKGKAALQHDDIVYAVVVYHAEGAHEVIFLPQIDP